MDYDPNPLIPGIGIGVVLFGFLLYLGTIALALWIGYLIMRTAVKNGILRADAERAERHRQAGPPPQYPPSAPPQRSP